MLLHDVAYQCNCLHAGFLFEAHNAVKAVYDEQFLAVAQSDAETHELRQCFQPDFNMLHGSTNKISLHTSSHDQPDDYT